MRLGRSQEMSRRSNSREIKRSGRKLHFTALMLATIGTVAGAVQNCSNGASSFSEAPPSAQAEAVFSAYTSYAENSDFKLSLDESLKADILKNPGIVDDVQFDGRKFTNLTKRIKIQSQNFAIRPKAPLSDFIKLEKNIGQVRAQDFDLAQNFYKDSLSSISSYTDKERLAQKYSYTDTLRALRAGAITRALLATAKKQQTQGNSGADRQALTELKLVGPGGLTVAKEVVDKLPEIVEAVGGLGKDVANAHMTVQLAEVVNACKQLVTTCNDQLEAEGSFKSSIDKTNADTYNEAKKTLAACENHEPDRTCTYGKARSKEALGGNEDKNCTSYTYWYCWCGDEEPWEKNPDGSFKHGADELCRNKPHSEYRKHPNWQQVKAELTPIVPFPVAGKAKNEGACHAYNTLCQNTVEAQAGKK